MPKISLAGFKDPVRRPRYIIWTGVAVLVMVAVMIVALGVTSTRWFCSEACHKVQDDTIIAYQHSTHAEISCMACHMPVGASPATFMLHKMEALGELYLTVTDKYTLPLNPESEVSLTMKSTQCTQCHNLENREITPSSGIKIEHEPHAAVNAACPVCHNRVAHNEDFELTLTKPEKQGGGENEKHADFMSMTACFRCHGLEKSAAAPGTCSACHPANFDLKPPSHKAKDFFPKGHAEMALEMKAEADAAAAGHEGEGEAGAEGEGAAEESGATTEESTATETKEASGTPGAKESDETSWLGPEKAYASGGEEVERVTKEEVPELLESQKEHAAEDAPSVGAALPTVESIFYCSTCHTEQFCTNCHGMAMPHPAEFKEPKDVKDPVGHPAVSKAKPEKCEMCHQPKKTFFCEKCHHGEKISWEYNTKTPWENQHGKAVAKAGVKSCTENCHTVKFCVTCHTKRAVVPESHAQKTWTRPAKPAMTVYGQTPAKPSAKHALDAQASIESCAVCHGEGGPNAKFCRACHKSEMPHKDEFKKNHLSGRKTIRVCANCHSWPETCSNCHHIGSSTTKPWIQVHGGSVNKNGTASCLECHGGESGTSKDFCVKCHNKRKAKPASHNGAKFVRDYSDKKAVHVQTYTKDGETCTYCHAGEAASLPTSKFCQGCHKLPMPHEIKSDDKQKFMHKEGFEKKQLKKAQCANCHKQAFCDSCHHEGSSTSVPWAARNAGAKVQHPAVVEKNGADACFECHEEVFCSSCHVRLSR